MKNRKYQKSKFLLSWTGSGNFGIFNHIGKKKITSDPTPIQVEMRKYEQDVDMAFIENAGRKGHEHDVS